MCFLVTSTYVSNILLVLLSHQVVYFLDLIKCDGKSALWSSSSCGDGVSFVDLVKEYSSRARRFIVEDEELRERIKSDLVSRCLLVIFLCHCMHDHCLFIYC